MVRLLALPLGLLLVTSLVTLGLASGPAAEPAAADVAPGLAVAATPTPRAATDVAVAESAICTKAAGCEFWDSNYHEYILYKVDTPTVDVLIVPPASPYATRDGLTMKKSVQAWEDGIDALGASWFAPGFDINPYLIGSDVPPTAALSDPEIIVVGAEANPFVLFGIGLQLPAGICTQRGGAIETFPTHEHDGMTLYSANCKQGGLTCVALNTNFLLGGIRRMYDLVSHEFGHCLGIGHVGDALDFDAKTVPLADIMSYQYNPAKVHCVSTLNVRSLEGVFAPLFGRPSSEFLNPGQYLAMAPSAYNQVACPNP